MAAPPRPYGVGPYGDGLYSRYSGAVYAVAGASSLSFAVHAPPQRMLSIMPARTSISFAVHAPNPSRVLQNVAAASSIVFTASAMGVQRILHAQALSSLTFSIWGRGIPTWGSIAPCETGAWQLPDPCETGTWTLPPPCIVGSWQITRLT